MWRTKNGKRQQQQLPVCVCAIKDVAAVAVRGVAERALEMG